MICPTGKCCYASAETARLKLIQIEEKREYMGKKGGKRRKEQYYYQCQMCGFWHLTKQQPRKKEG